MKINVGSKNKVKVDAVREVLADYELFGNAEVEGVDVSSGVSDQPKSLDETITGAMNRAKAAFQDCDFSFGMEDGLMQVPNTKSGYMNVCVCAIFDGQKLSLGLSSAYEFPLEVTRLVFAEGLDINQASNRVGLTENPKVGSTSEGVVGILTASRLSRQSTFKQAMVTALIHLQNPELY